MSSWWANQQVNNPASQAESINNTMALANAGHAANAATTQGNALKTASGTIGGAKVDEVTAITDARATYESESATNDKTYLNAIVIAESTYLKVVANKSHEFRTGAITAEERDSAIATAWGTYQTAAKGTGIRTGEIRRLMRPTIAPPLRKRKKRLSPPSPQQRRH
jgi:hypothetical protein